MTDWYEWRISGEELAQRQFLIVDADDSPFAFREAAILWAKEHGIIGTMAETETGGKGCVGISIGSLREMLNPVQIGKSCGLKVHFAAVTVLRDLIRESVIVEAYFDRLKGANGIRDAANGVNRNVMILVGYAAMRFKGELYRAKLTFKRFADANVASKAYAYHVTRIEVLTGTIGNDLSGTAPNANTSTTNQGKANFHLTPNILLHGVVDVNGVQFVGGRVMTAAELKASILDLAVRGLLVPQDPKDKPAAKPSDIDDPPYELPRNWVWKQLKDLGGFHGGHTPSMSDRSLWGGDILWVSSKDVKSNEIWDTQDKLTPRGAELLEEVCVDSLVMVTRSGILKHTFPVAVVKNNCRINQDLKAFVPADKRFSPFLAWCLRGLQPFILKHYRKNGTTVQSIVWDEFIRMPIPLPPLPEQKRIVAKIGELLPLVEEYGEAQKELEALNADFPAALRESILQDAVQGKLTVEWRRARVERFGRFETARDLLDQITAEKKRLLAAKKIKKEKPLPPITDDEKPFEIPDTWAWCRLCNIIQSVGGRENQVLAKSVSPNGKFPVVSQGQSLVDGFSDDESKVVFDVPVIMFGDHTRNVKYVDFPFVIGADGTKFFKTASYPRWLYYWTVFQASQIGARGYGRHWGLLNEVLVALPPIAEQKAIVERVDELLKIVDAMKAQ